MDLMDNSLILLKRVVIETKNGGRLKTTTRNSIIHHITAVEKDKEFLTDIIGYKEAIEMHDAGKNVLSCPECGKPVPEWAAECTDCECVWD